jgi:hypothetical protein
LRSIAVVTFARRLGFAGAIACAAALGPALAAEPKPDFSFKTKWVEASVILDAKIKTDPGAGGELPGRGKEMGGEKPRRCRQGTQAGARVVPQRVVV